MTNWQTIGKLWFFCPAIYRRECNGHGHPSPPRLHPWSAMHYAVREMLRYYV